ncbi:uncharacterized protein LOC107865525 [Capsicum annuum]|uniref:uncharacterized protein LOC107865525 n=1 Tax=Capsicum annuum TaxID=4072 RepID=UPI0007BEECC4|nr:uncharacterized protein LOC107865525 [Capsicum annuum]
MSDSGGDNDDDQQPFIERSKNTNKFMDYRKILWQTYLPNGCNPADHFNLDSKLIASLLLPFFRNNPQFKVKDVQTIFEVELKHTHSYKKAWIGRKRSFKFIYGDFDYSFAQLPRYRPVISIDGTHIYGKYDIKMLIVVTADANGQIFSLVFAIVNKETKEEWSWFLSCLGIHVVVDRRGVTYISDRAPEILRSFNDLFELHEPNAYHCFCLRHVKINFLSNFPNKQLEGLMWQAAIQHQECKFKAVMQSLKDAEPGAYNFLMKIPLEK